MRHDATPPSPLPLPLPQGAYGGLKTWSSLRAWFLADAHECAAKGLTFEAWYLVILFSAQSRDMSSLKVQRASRFCIDTFVSRLVGRQSTGRRRGSDDEEYAATRTVTHRADSQKKDARGETPPLALLTARAIGVSLSPRAPRDAKRTSAG